MISGYEPQGKDMIGLWNCLPSMQGYQLIRPVSAFFAISTNDDKKAFICHGQCRIMLMWAARRQFYTI